MTVRPAQLYPWFTPVNRLKGVGPAMSTALTRLLPGVRPVEDDSRPLPVLRDLLFHLPGGVIDRTHVTPITQLERGQYATVEVTISEHRAPPPTRYKLPYKIAAHDDSGNMMLTFFHVKGDYLTKQLPVGEKRLISGHVDMFDGMAVISHPDSIARVEHASEVLRMIPSYPLTAGVSNKLVARLTSQALGQLPPLPEWQDGPFLKQQSWPSFTDALKAIHQPGSIEALLPISPERARLAYDELLANQLALALARRTQQRQQAPAIPFDADIDETLTAALPFTFTNGQRMAFAEMMGELKSGRRMVRLLQGDVGSGKTILAFALMAQVAAAGGQACLMAPTDLLARQHYASLKKYADALQIPLALLTGKMRKDERKDVQQALAMGRIPLVVGTHALFQEQVEFKRLAFVVVDEQHRFGVGQRMRLTAKGDAPHLLQMTATPIPRSLSMTMYGDMDVSSLKDKPQGRKPIETVVVPDAREAEIIQGLGRVMAAGEKAYWVCPLIEKSEIPSFLRKQESRNEYGADVGIPAFAGMTELDLTAAEERFKVLENHFPGKVGLIHGKMKVPEREKVMQAFAFGDIQLLVATTVIEVGVDVPSATVMVIEHAERFGLAQMHQLRGRVGRGDKPSRCVLLYHNKLSQHSKDRLRILRETNDGFLIAEEDLRLRGEGDMVGTRQTGLPDYVLADMSAHLPLIRIAHDDAALVLNNDAALEGARGQAIRLLLGLFEYDTTLALLQTH